MSWVRGIAVGAAATAFCVHAEGPDVVVISATRVEQPALEIPASIDRLYGEDLRQGRAQVNLSESLARLPGIVVQNRQNYAQDLQISSRGFGARATFGVRGIRLIADGIPATMPDGQGQAATFALGSASRIEVLRGPFSSLYGNASGGVINIVTEDGPQAPQLEGALSAGSYGAVRGALKLGGERRGTNYVIDLSRFEADGYRDHSAVRRDHLNAKLRFGLGEGTALTLLANSLRQPQTQDPLGLNRADFETNPRQVAAGAIAFNTRKSVAQDQIGATLTHRLGAATRIEATLWGGQRDVEQYLAIPLPTQNLVTHSGGVVNLDRAYGGGALRFSTETRFAGRALRLSAGVEREAMAERRRGFINDGGTSGALKRDEDNSVTGTDAYAQLEWRMAERWSLHAGLRSSRVRFRSNDHFAVPGSANGDDSGARSYRAATPVVGVVFRLDRLTSLYANLGRGFETPTFVELAYRNPGAGTGLNFDLNAGRSRHFEAGLKTIVPGRLRLNAALFDVLTRDEIVTDRSSGGRATFKNAGHTGRRGIEIGAETLFDGPFDARVACTWLAAEFRDGFTTVTGTPAVNVSVPAGSLLPGVPRSQLYAELRWRHAPSGFHASFEWLRRSRVAVNDPNSEFANAYSTANLVAGFAQQGSGWTLSEFLRIDNLADRSYAGSVVVNDGNGRYYEPAPRRNVLVGLQGRLSF
ncbi:MAG: TonB-dependent receptor [Betaproteobacteria bacterium]|nr:MAG: TonB-dependent receptor [Betaproteobacteria bacterium]